MKALIIAACLCIIGMTGWLALNSYADHRHSSRMAFQAKCDRVLGMWRDGKPDLSGKSESELRDILATANECRDHYLGRL